MRKVFSSIIKFSGAAIFFNTGCSEEVYPLLRKKMLGFENATINAGLR